jgi:ribosomal protein L18
MLKKIARLRRAKTTRSRIRILGVPRLSVLRTGQHLYAQLFGFHCAGRREGWLEEWQEH